MKRFLTLLLCLALLSACGGRTPAPEEEMRQPFKLYYCADLTNEAATEAIGWEYRELGEQTWTPEELLRLYLRGPRSEGLSLPVPETLEIVDVALTDGILLLQTNDAVRELSGVRRTLAAACLTLTMTQLAEIDAVCVQVDGKELSGGWSGPWTAEDFQLTDTLTVAERGE